MKAVLAVLLLWAGTALADEAPAARGMGAATATRAVAQYTGLEQRLLEALQAHDRAAAQQLLAEDFELREPDSADPIAGTTWLDHWMTARLRDFRIQDLAVRELGEITTVSFLQYSRGSMAGAKLPRVAYVVDLWRGDRLLLRYASTPAHARVKGGPQPRR